MKNNLAMSSLHSLRHMSVILLMTCSFDFATTNMTKAGIVNAEGNLFVKKFHANPDAYLGWEVRKDATIWFYLDCMQLNHTQYCGFGLSEPGPSAGNGTGHHHDADIYTAHRGKVEDRYGDASSSSPRLDRHQDVRCDHCGVLDGRLHATFYRNLSTGDAAQDVSITNRTYRVSWAIGALGEDDIGRHNFTPRTDREYMYINFIDPHATVVPQFETVAVSEAARSIETVLVAALGGAVLALVLR